MKTCTIPACQRPMSYPSRGWCNAHYLRWLRHGDPLKTTKGPKHRKCSIEGCGAAHFGKGYCQKHYERHRKTGDPLKCLQTPPGSAIDYYNDVVLSYEGDECLIWPFNRDFAGYGKIRCGETSGTVSRLVCERVHGRPPTPKHEAAHSCGNGHLGCVTKRHMSWKTRAENQADRIKHGTSNRGERCRWTKLTEAQVRDIFAQRGAKSAKDVAREHNIAESTVQNIRAGIRWGWLTSSEVPR